MSIDGIKCPWCGHRSSTEDDVLEDGMNEFTCNNCDRDFHCELERSWHCSAPHKSLPAKPHLCECGYDLAQIVSVSAVYTQRMCPNCRTIHEFEVERVEPEAVKE